MACQTSGRFLRFSALLGIVLTGSTPRVAADLLTFKGKGEPLHPSAITSQHDGKVVPEDHRYAMRNKANQLWHTDSSFKSVPALTSVLSARTIPDHGGETEFVSTRLAFERLDPALQKKFENSFAWHHYGHSRAKVAAVALAMPAVGCFLLWTTGASDIPTLVIATFLVGVGAGAEFDVAAYLVSRYFGLRDYGRLFGVHLGLITAGAALAPLLTGAIYKATGSYSTMLALCGAAFLMGALMLLPLGRYPKFAQAE